MALAIGPAGSDLEAGGPDQRVDHREPEDEDGQPPPLDAAEATGRRKARTSDGSMSGDERGRVQHDPEAGEERLQGLDLADQLVLVPGDLQHELRDREGRDPDGREDDDEHHEDRARDGEPVADAPPLVAAGEGPRDEGKEQTEDDGHHDGRHLAQGERREEDQDDRRERHERAGEQTARAARVARVAGTGREVARVASRVGRFSARAGRARIPRRYGPGGGDPVPRRPDRGGILRSARGGAARPDPPPAAIRPDRFSPSRPSRVPSRRDPRPARRPPRGP